MDYNDLIDDLLKNRNEKFKSFNNKIIGNTKYKILGIKTPNLKKLATKYYAIKDDIINRVNYEYYEEIILRGFVIMKIKDYKEFMSLVFDHIKYCDTWAHVDQFSPKIIKEHLNDFFSTLKTKINSSNPWMIRFILVIFLGYYINDDYLEEILKISDNIRNDEYYVKMANAWLISYIIIYNFDLSLKFLKNSTLDSFTINKAISKARDSLKVSKESKEVLLLYRRK